MSEKISREDVRKVALLSRLEVTDEEIDRFTGQLGAILEYASMIDKLDLSDVEPTSHVMPIKNVFREDIAKNSIPVEDVLKNAPESFGNYFCVPKIMDETSSH